MNGVYIRASNIERIVDLCLPFLQKAGLVSNNPAHDDLEYMCRVISLEKDRLRVLSEVVQLTDFFFLDKPEYDPKGVSKWLKRDYVPDLLKRLRAEIEQVEDFELAAIEEMCRRIGEEIGLSGGQVIHPIRMAVTGRTVGPGLFETISVLGKDRVLQRIDRTLILCMEE
jgi:glutamyl-tRNA synthetase